ncbi:hypothetical protein IKQ19_08030 [Candidatus Saccharibacteria bacterium]|nr:hypothetical protein [Candidatus Saccharibacteria bacterium]
MKLSAFFIAVLCAILWAKPSVFIPAVELDGVHQDYADKLVRWTKGYIESKKDVRVVEYEIESDFILQIKMLRKDEGIVVVYTLMNSNDKKEVWTYKHMAYTPDDLIPIVDVTTMKFGQWNGVRVGLGLGTLGLTVPEFAAAPSVDFMLHFLYSNFLASLDFNWGIDEKLGDDDFWYLGISVSPAYVFDGRFAFPFVGAGAGWSFMEYESDKYSFANNGSGEGLTLFLKAGVLFKPVDYKTIFAIDIRYLYNFYEIQKISTKGWMPVQGWSVSAQVWW